jgi:hypothetical protein
MVRRFVIAAFLPFAVLLIALARPAPAQQQGPASVDHSAWTKLLKRYVDDHGLVDYKTWKANDVPAVDAYLSQLAAVKNETDLPKNERLALWINAYNAITIRAILEFHPVKSIKDKVSFFGYSVWKDYKKTIAGREVYLDQIENELLRKMGEPRIHFAINCASKGCPVLRQEAYDGATLDAQLEDQVQRFLANPEKFRADTSPANTDKDVYVSLILKWFKEDFGGSTEARLHWLAEHVKDEATKKLLLDKDADLEFLDYDWNLNEKP